LLFSRGQDVCVCARAGARCVYVCDPIGFAITYALRAITYML
jgi:hypothetical protein